MFKCAHIFYKRLGSERKENEQHVFKLQLKMSYACIQFEHNIDGIESLDPNRVKSLLGENIHSKGHEERMYTIQVLFTQKPRGG